MRSLYARNGTPVSKNPLFKILWVFKQCYSCLTIFIGKLNLLPYIKFYHSFVGVLLSVFLSVSTSVQALELGEQVKDFVMPTKGAPHRLSEQIGKPVMLIWLADCDACEEELISWQYFAETMAAEGLVTWFIWRNNSSNQPPWSRLPVLEYNNNNEQAWWVPSDSPYALMLINPNGDLDYLFTTDIQAEQSEISNTVRKWLFDRPWFPLEGFK